MTHSLQKKKKTRDEMLLALLSIYCGSLTIYLSLIAFFFLVTRVIVIAYVHYSTVPSSSIEYRVNHSSNYRS